MESKVSNLTDLGFYPDYLCLFILNHSNVSEHILVKNIHKNKM